MQKKVLVTGGAGFLGSHLCEGLVAQGQDVLCVDNYFTGLLSTDALGITACLYAYSHCSFSRNEEFGKLCASHYHFLRAYMFEHPEVTGILGAID